jgi:hypothetical protein
MAAAGGHVIAWKIPDDEDRPNSRDCLLGADLQRFRRGDASGRVPTAPPLICEIGYQTLRENTVSDAATASAATLRRQSLLNRSVQQAHLLRYRATSRRSLTTQRGGNVSVTTA